MPFSPNSALYEKISSEVSELARLRYQLHACFFVIATYNSLDTLINIVF